MLSHAVIVISLLIIIIPGIESVAAECDIGKLLCLFGSDAMRKLNKDTI